MRLILASLLSAATVLLPQRIAIRVTGAPPSPGDVITASDFTLVGYKDIRVLTENSSGVYSDGFETGLTYRRVSGDLRFILANGHSQFLAEWSMNGITFDNGSADAVATNHWTPGGGVGSQDDGCGFVMLSATKVLETCTESYSNQPTARLYTFDLDPTGNGVSNFHGPVGLHGIGAKRVGDCAVIPPSVVTAAYPDLVALVGCGAYHSRAAQNRSASLAPTFIGIPDPTGYPIVTGVTTTTVSASSPTSVIFTSVSGFAVGDGITFDDASCGGNSYIFGISGTTVTLGTQTYDAGGFDCTMSPGVSVIQLGEIPSTDYKIFANQDGTSFNTFCDSWYVGNPAPINCDRGYKLAVGTNYQDMAENTTPGKNNPGTVTGTVNTSSSGNALVFTSTSRDIDAWWAGYSGTVGGNTVNSNPPPYAITITGVDYPIATWSDLTHMTVTTNPGNQTGASFVLPYIGPLIPPTDGAGWLASNDPYGRAAPDGFSRWWQGDSYFAGCVAIDGVSRSGFMCMGSMTSVTNYYCTGNFCIGGNTNELHIFDNANLLEAAAGTREKWNVRPVMTDWTSFLTYSGPYAGGGGRTFQPSAVIRDTTTGAVYIYRPNGGGTNYTRIYKLTVNTSAPVPLLPLATVPILALVALTGRPVRTGHRPAGPGWSPVGKR